MGKDSEVIDEEIAKADIEREVNKPLSNVFL